ncbi:MAG: glutathione S-transferase family protein [Marinibacterium sp.]
MLTLLTFPPGFGDFSLSPFCTKAAYLLAMSGETWQRRDVMNAGKAPYGKLPVLKLETGQLIAETARIQAFLEDRGAAFDRDLSVDQQIEAHMLTRLAEEHLYFLVLWDRWANDAAWPAFREAAFHPLPTVFRRPISALARRKVRASLRGQGIGRLPEDQLLGRADADLSVIAARLATGPFLFGDRPGSADASVAPVLSALRDGPTETALTRRVKNNAVLSDYVDRMRVTFPLT